MGYDMRPLLPYDIVFDIISRLPVKSLCRFQVVSKQWLDLITTDPQFFRAQFQRSNENKKLPRLMVSSLTINPSVIRSLEFLKSPNNIVPTDFPNVWRCHRLFLGSCYGVLLLGGDLEPLVLWNPSTRKHRILPSPPSYDCRVSVTQIQGLSYDSIRDDFKVIWAFSPHARGSVDPIPECLNHVYVFSSRSSSWKRIGALAYYRHYDSWTETYLAFRECLDSQAVVFDGAPHWVVTAHEGGAALIVYFDPNEETLKQLLPKLSLETEFALNSLAILGGNLCLVRDTVTAIEAWVLKESSWTKLFFVPQKAYRHYLKTYPCEGRLFSHASFQTLCLWEENGEEVVMMVNSEVLALYSMKYNTFRSIEIPEDKDKSELHPFRDGRVFDATSYVESLVSPYNAFGTRRDH